MSKGRYSLLQGALIPGRYEGLRFLAKLTIAIALVEELMYRLQGGKVETK